MKKTKHFWDFSLWTYHQEGVEPSCLKLQNHYECDVNLLLFCCWGGITVGVIPEDIIIRAVDYSKHWRSEIVQPLRDIRIRMKGRKWLAAAKDHEQLRNQVKSSELKAERLQQVVLEQLIYQVPAVQSDSNMATNAIIENLDRYFRIAGISIDNQACDDLAVILYAVVSKVNIEVICSKLDRIAICCRGTT